MDPMDQGRIAWPKRLAIKMERSGGLMDKKDSMSKDSMSKDTS